MSSILATSSMSSRTPMSALRRSKTRGDSPGEVLVVAARLDADRRSWLGPTLGDGTLTRLRTFQKYFAQDELTGWVNEATGAASLAAAPGVLYVFRDPVRRETFAASQFRSKGRRLSFAVSADLYRENRTALDALAAFYCDHGRLPRADEFMEPDGLLDSFGSVRRASTFLRGLVGPPRWDDVRRERSADLLVYLALARFRGRPRLSGLPPALQWDIRSLFSTYKFACATADTLLFRAGEVAAVDQACRDSAVGKLTPTALYIHESALPVLSPLLRVVRGVRAELPWRRGGRQHHQALSSRVQSVVSELSRLRPGSASGAPQVGERVPPIVQGPGSALRRQSADSPSEGALCRPFLPTPGDVREVNGAGGATPTVFRDLGHRTCSGVECPGREGWFRLSRPPPSDVLDRARITSTRNLR